MPSARAVDPVSRTPQLGPETPLRQLVETLLGAEVGVFGAEQAGLPDTCCIECIENLDRPDLPGACAVVKQMHANELQSEDTGTRTCDRGHRITVHQGEASNTSLLILRPNRSENREERSHVDRDTFSCAAALLWEQCERLEEENKGLASEVLNSYEQLNVIFDITRRIGASRDGAEVKHFLMARLAQSLMCEWACCISTRDGTLWWSHADDVDRDATLDHLERQHRHLMDQVVERRAVTVHNRLDCRTSDGCRHLLLGPLAADSNNIDIMVFARPDPEFVAAEMSITDSVLQHGQNVLTNLQLVERLRTMSYGAVRALVSAIDKKDNYTCGHSERVGFLSYLIGEQMGLTPEQLQDLEWAGLLHDVGKIGIYDGILTKPGKLSNEEFDHIKQHARMSYEIVAPVESFASVKDVVLYHHEMPDGSGYPAGLKGHEIPLMARIVHVADTFDALTSTRSYRKAFPVDKAIEIMRQDSGTKLDAEAVEAFVAGFRAFEAEQPTRFREVFRHFEEATDA